LTDAPLVHLSGANTIPVGLGIRGGNASLAGADMAGDERPHFLTGANATKIGPRPISRKSGTTYADKAKGLASNDMVQAQPAAGSTFPRRLSRFSQPKPVAWEQMKQKRHCSRCLANDHWRVNCIQPIRCHA